MSPDCHTGIADSPSARFPPRRGPAEALERGVETAADGPASSSAGMILPHGEASHNYRCSLAPPRGNLGVGVGFVRPASARPPALDLLVPLVARRPPAPDVPRRLQAAVQVGLGPPRQLVQPRRVVGLDRPLGGSGTTTSAD